MISETILFINKYSQAQSVFKYIVQMIEKNEIRLSFGHNLLHMLSGINYIRIYFSNIDENEIEKLLMIWMLHDLGHDASKYDDEQEHSKRSIEILKRILNDLHFEQSIIDHFSYVIDKHSKKEHSNNKLVIYLILIDYMSLRDSFVVQPNSLDRVLISKVEELYYDVILNRKVRVEKIGNEQGSANVKLKNKLTEIYTTLESLEDYSKEFAEIFAFIYHNLADIEINYFGSKRYIYTLSKYQFIIRHRLGILKNVSLFLHPKMIILASVIVKEFDVNREILLSLHVDVNKSYIVRNYKNLMDNNFNNDYYKSISSYI